MQNITKKAQDVNHELINFIADNPPPVGVDVPLAVVSERDKVWDNHRSDTHDVSTIYTYSTDFAKYAERMRSCSPYLDFSIDSDSGLKLKRSFFCHVRHCPVCQWRKSLYWKAMMYKTYDAIKDEYLTHRWLFLTLTLENCNITDLRSTLQHMHKAFVKLTKRKEFKNVVGFVRTTEVTRDKKRPYTHAHPHYHCMILVKPDYFNKGNYVKKMDWVRAWGACLNVNYLPNLDIRVMRSKDDDNDIRGVVAETLKYACKPSDMIFDNTPQSHAWFFEYTKQVHKMRFVNSGGVLKNALKSEKEITDTDMIALSDDVNLDDETDKRLLSFVYHSSKRSYIYKPYFFD